LPIRWKEIVKLSVSNKGIRRMPSLGFGEEGFNEEESNNPRQTISYLAL